MTKGLIISMLAACFATAAVAAERPGGAAESERSARQRVIAAKSYCCYYGAGRADELAKFDVVILHTPAATADVVKQLKAAGVVTIGYITCGEDIELRKGDGTGPGGMASWYFDKDKDGKADQHEIWKSYYTNAADAKWRDDRIAEAKRLIHDVGFDGLFLDTVDDVSVFPETFDGMVELIRDFRRELPDAPIIMNQSWELLRRVKSEIDGLMLEGFTTSYDFVAKSYRRNPVNWDDASLKAVNEYVLPVRRENSMQVFVLDYARPDETQLHQDAADRAATFGFLHCIAPVLLDDLYAVQTVARPQPKYLERQTTPQMLSIKLDAPRNGFPAGTIVTPSDCFPGYTVAPIVDGVADHSALEWSKAAWASAEGDEPSWLEFQLPEPRRGGALRIEWQPNHASRAFVVQTRAADAEKWIDGVTIRDKTNEKSVIQLPAEPYSSIRIYQRGGDGSALRPKLMWISAVTLQN